MGFEGDYESDIPVAEDIWLFVLAAAEDSVPAIEETDVPVAEFQSSV